MVLCSLTGCGNLHMSCFLVNNRHCVTNFPTFLLFTHCCDGIAICIRVYYGDSYACNALVDWNYFPKHENRKAGVVKYAFLHVDFEYGHNFDLIHFSIAGHAIEDIHQQHRFSRKYAGSLRNKIYCNQLIWSVLPFGVVWNFSVICLRQGKPKLFGTVACW